MRDFDPAYRRSWSEPAVRGVLGESASPQRTDINRRGFEAGQCGHPGRLHPSRVPRRTLARRLLRNENGAATAGKAARR
jgi:hypothetical protein